MPPRRAARRSAPPASAYEETVDRSEGRAARSCLDGLSRKFERVAAAREGRDGRDVRVEQGLVVAPAPRVRLLRAVEGVEEEERVDGGLGRLDLAKPPDEGRARLEDLSKTRGAVLPTSGFL